MKRLRAAIALLLLSACAAPPTDASLRALDADELRLSIAQNRAHVLAHQNLTHETVVLTAENGQIGYARLAARQTDEGRSELVALTSASYIPNYEDDGIVVLDDGERNSWLAFFVDPRARAIRLHIAFADSEVINTALLFDCAIVSDPRFELGESEASVTALDIDGRPVHTSVLRYDTSGRQWRTSGD
jgi:hypothetical protein